MQTRRSVDGKEALETTVGRLLEENRLPKEQNRHRLFDEEHIYTFARTALRERKLYQTAKVLPYAREKHKNDKGKGDHPDCFGARHGGKTLCGR